MPNLKEKVAQGLPAELVRIIQLASEIARERGEKLYLVGGVVRDLLLGEANLDIDLVAEGGRDRASPGASSTQRGGNHHLPQLPNG
ncbi:MAG: hypothetical protein V1849_04450 [Chloroflexota bacterium]